MIMADSEAPLEIAVFFDELRQPLFRYLRCAGLGREDAEEGVQETFLRLQQHLEAQGDRSNLRGWIFQVARNLARNEIKSTRRRRTEAFNSARQFAAPQSTPEQLAIDRDQARRLQRSLERLSAPQRECILLRAAGLRYREIAEVLGIGISSVGELVQRATARLVSELSLEYRLQVDGNPAGAGSRRRLDRRAIRVAGPPCKRLPSLPRTTRSVSGDGSQRRRLRPVRRDWTALSARRTKSRPSDGYRPLCRVAAAATVLMAVAVGPTFLRRWSSIGSSRSGSV